MEKLPKKFMILM